MIVFDKVSKQFFNDTYGVKDVSFVIDSGELILITGPTGSGKTTLMRLVTKEHTPTEGEVIFDDLPLSKVKPSLLPLHRRRIGVVFQDYRLLPESNVWENVALPLLIAGKSSDEIEERVTDLLKLVKLEDKFELFPNELSGGEAQRVSIARALAVAPPVLFADEPTGNLDKESSLAIINLLKKINQLGTTVLVSTHDVVVLEEMAAARRLELKNGELVLDTQPKKRRVKKKEEEIEKKKDKPKQKKTPAKKVKKDAPKTKEKVEDLEESKPKKKGKK
ncbi:MAG: ATP-binding cassette domain-containing protein [Candidatus Pacebacteria bacterium]|jgi:cell division transport system ATP-binding protein|nr:ATP-binding cassette domain-containing protein [Candidatus Paceibacterota bacterium]MBT3512192.1 ATP-binding cassette domain-containing protein [Candidatus Paceibacterota bacterium]MBT4004578.1 ATP-binding cassette domain-containing protein [Candidatus Paceibacterota bacterium]MBT4359174.1 ATP-binding cassette domain-containing protein [Candidatus Paceibacterota bacterium]MBT4681060.1 ATP-binding cassette domain-containing protein [Candidatus Paceibacterota bacterium]